MPLSFTLAFTFLMHFGKSTAYHECINTESNNLLGYTVHKMMNPTPYGMR